MPPEKRFLISVEEVQPIDVGDEEGFRGVDSRLVICDQTMGSENACLFRVIFPKGAYHGPHYHTASDELLYALRGQAIQWVDGVAYVMTPGTAMLIPKNAVHWMRNDWDEDFEVIGIYPDATNFEATDQHLADDPARYGFSTQAEAAGTKEFDHLR